MGKNTLEYFVIFGGGGIRGTCYVGAYKALLEQQIKITGYAGSSIGSVFAALCAVEYEYELLKSFFYGISIEFFKDINFNFGNQLALSKGELFLEWMRDKIESAFYKDEYKKGKMPPVRFCDLKKDLIIYSTDLTNSKFKEFSKECTPDAEVALAVRASVSMPGLFRPLELEDSLIVDGDLAKSWPLWRLSETLSKKSERIIEFRLEDNESKRSINSAYDYMNAVYNTISGFATDYIIDLYKDKDKFDYIKINTDRVSVVDFMINAEKKQELMQTGYKATKTYLANVLPQKRKQLAKEYEGLLEIILRFEKEFQKKKIKDSLVILCELFVYLCEHKRCIELDIYNKIILFKKEYDANLIKKFGLLFSKNEYEVIHPFQIQDKLDEIIRDVTLKVAEIKD